MTEATETRIHFACQECDQRLSIGSSKIGKKVKCPKCGHPNLVPSAEAAAVQMADRKLRKEEQKQTVETLPAHASQDFTQFTVYDDEREFVYEGDDGAGAYFGGNIDPNKVAVSRNILYFQGVLLGLVALAAFSFGWYVGQATNRPLAAAEDLTPKIIRGTLKFRDGSQREQPDAGSVVILVPEDRRPDIDEKVTIAGLRPDDPMPEADSESMTHLKLLGGAYARADAEGNFRLEAPKRGKYFVLIISGNSRRSGGDEMKKDDLAQIGRYFTPAMDLLGENRFRWTAEPIGSDRIFDFTFGG